MGGGTRSVTSASAASFSARARSQRSRLIAPTKISVSDAGSVEPAFAAQSQHILQRNHRQARHRLLRQTNERPVNPVFARPYISLNRPPLALRNARLPPAQRGVVIVSAGVDDAIGRETMRQINMGAGIGETKLQHRQSGNLVTLPQRMHLGRDVAQVFGEKRQPAQGVTQLC